MQFNVFNDFVIQERVVQEVVDEYEGRLPE